MVLATVRLRSRSGKRQRVVERDDGARGSADQMKPLEAQQRDERVQIVGGAARLGARVELGASPADPVVGDGPVSAARSAGQLTLPHALLPLAACSSTTGVPVPPVSTYHSRRPASAA